jgi:sulfur-oxidizing protein SoxA
MNIKRFTVGLVGLGAALAFAAPVTAEEIRSGYSYATVDTQALQNDEMQNPGMLWVDTGSEIWEKVEGDAGKSCSTCHGAAEKSMKGVSTAYPKYKDKLGKLQSVVQRINQCRTENMKAKAWKWESNEMLAMGTYVAYQSRGLPVTVAIDGPAKPFFEKGRDFFNQRRGQLDMSCKNCHEEYSGVIIRANVLSQGQINGFPVYRMKWGKVGSAHRRFRGCNKNVRATPYSYGAEEYVNLELYVAWRGRGLKGETPAVRN